jgi:hypothetical protein
MIVSLSLRFLRETLLSHHEPLPLGRSQSNTSVRLSVASGSERTFVRSFYSSRILIQ